MYDVIAWTQASAQRQLAVAVGVSSALFLATTRVVMRHLADEEADGHLVNVAGRQRMLTQRMAREALAVAAGDESARARLRSAAGEFERGLVDLIEGAPGRGLPESQAVARERLRTVEARWPEFAGAVARVGRDTIGSASFAEGLHYVLQHADGLLHDTESVVAHFDDAFSNKVQRLRRRMTALGIAGAGVLGVTYVGLLAGARRRAERAESDVRRKERELEERAEERRDLVRRLLSASEDERRRVAAEIHDGPTQQLTGAAMLLEAALQDGKAGALSPRVVTALDYLNTALDETRRIITDLRPPLLDDLGVVEALQRALRSPANDFGVAVSFEAASVAQRAPAEVELALYRVAHEAVMNALRYAGAPSVQVRLSHAADGVTLVVTDRGKGFDLASVGATPGRRALGLLGMRERVDLLGGRFNIVTAPGAGTTVTAWIPARRAGGAA